MQLRYSNTVGLGVFGELFTVTPGNFLKVVAGKVCAGVITSDVREEHVGQDIALKRSWVTSHVRRPTLLHEACVWSNWSVSSVYLTSDMLPTNRIT